MQSNKVDPPAWFEEVNRLRAPDWFRTILEESGQKMTPEQVNVELEGVPPSARSRVRTELNKVKLPGVGGAYKQSQVASHSYYNEPITIEGPLRGKSRKWGDTTPEAKKEIINQIVEQGAAAGLDKDDIAYVLAEVHHESGFNPDAAAGTTSAHGLGQFINRTGQAYGLTDANRWDINEQVRAMIEHFKENKQLASGKDRDWIYAYHHDGPSLAYGGIGISRKYVHPLYEMYKEALG